MKHHYRPVRKHPQISLLIPFRYDHRAPERLEIFEWVISYWRAALPDAEILVGRSRGKVFSKTEAVNDAARRAKGRVFVIIDSDAYLRPEVIQHAADEIDRATRRGQRLWFVPYQRLYRLTKAAGRAVLNSNPEFPLQFPQPPMPEDILNSHGSLHGHRFGALIQMMPREAFELVGGMDPRFRGWGGEDVAFVRAVDTLYGTHKTTTNDILHIWHPTIGSSHKDRMWEGQTEHFPNSVLVNRYNRATGDPAKMRLLVDEAFPKPWYKKTWTLIKRAAAPLWVKIVAGGIVLVLLTRLIGDHVLR